MLADKGNHFKQRTYSLMMNIYFLNTGSKDPAILIGLYIAKITGKPPRGKIPFCNITSNFF